MSKISKIAHIADIHIRKTPTRNNEYLDVFKRLIESLKKSKPDRIVIVGDLVHDYLDLQGEQLIMASDLLNDLSKIAPVRVTRGNHDCRRKNLKRIDSVEAIVKTLKNPNVIYYNKTGIFYDNNIAWMVWHYGESKNNPWKTKEGKLFVKNRVDGQYITIDLFHDPITGCKSATGFEMKSKSYYKISEFIGDYSFLGDIHRKQYLDKNKTKAYSGSLIAQDFSEGDDSFHGYLLWDVISKTVDEISIYNDYSYKNIKLTPYTDFDDLDFEIDEPTKYMKVRFVWGTLPQTRNNQTERKVIDYIKTKYGNLTISHKNEFIEDDKIDLNESITLSNITEKTIQDDVFREYLEKIGVEDDIIDEIIALDDEITTMVDIDEISNIEWDIVKFGGKNFMSYDDLDIDWCDMDGLYQIAGINTGGKTTIMKLITYLLFGKTLETEHRVKYGDSRFINNRNGAKYCEAYKVIKANDEYFGIKRRTEITTDKTGQINGAPTTLSYYALSSPDAEMNDDSLVDNLDEDRRLKTQKKLNKIIGSYDNFMRIVMTTSDTLNKVLSSNMADFIDSLLFDSGLDIFDRKLDAVKIYEKSVNEKSKVTCNVGLTETQNATLTQEIREIKGIVNELENVSLPNVKSSIKKGRDYVELLTKKLFKIDDDIYNLNVDDTNEDIDNHNKEIGVLEARKGVIEANIKPLKETYDEERLNALNQKKDTHKTDEHAKKLEIKEHERQISNEQHKIEIINGEIFRLKEDGAKHKKEIFDLKGSKICPTCGQAIDKKEHIEHINTLVSEKEVLMYAVGDKIKEKEKEIIPINAVIEKHNESIIKINKDISTKSLELDDILKEIGALTNDKNDVDKRTELQNELNQIPSKIENEELKLEILRQKINNYDNSLKQIEENKKIDKGIDAAKTKITKLEERESELKENILTAKNQIIEKQSTIDTNKTLIVDFEIQEKRDMIIDLYKKCVHRDGIPRQLLVNYIIPKINVTLENILSVAPFSVWLDINDLRPKLVYNNRPDAIIDCISASGKERTFSSVVLKFALNQINVKSKPTIFLLDEVMGKLDENSVEEFIEILDIIKKSVKKLLVIEQRINIEPDYLIDVELDDDGISSLSIS